MRKSNQKKRYKEEQKGGGQRREYSKLKVWRKIWKINIL